MGNKLVVVESPAKARTIKKYLGKGFEVLASYGHVRDLRPKEGAVEPDNDFEMHYESIERNEKHVAALERAMRKADGLVLATDPDREGEAIAWHVMEVLRERDVLDAKPVERVVFYEITQRAIQDAIDHARGISMDLVNAQQARRALDYLVGFNLSPLLWRKIRRGLSAGRVQSPALRMIVEREEEIERFQRREYWTIEVDLERDTSQFPGRLTHFQGEKLGQFSIEDEARANQVRGVLEEHAAGRLRVLAVERKQRRRNPAPPFITSTLQQEAARKLGFTAQRTMRIAQQLYEGVETGEGSVGLITYMRTDSTSLAQEAVVELRQFIEEQYGKENVPARPREFKTRAKNAQEAHEAVRPTSVSRTPEAMKSYLSREQHLLYQLVWRRTVACQMQHALINTVAVDMGCGEAAERPATEREPGVFRATGSTIAKPGFLLVYEEGTDDSVEDGERRLPALDAGDVVTLRAMRADQHFTEPPPRYSEASLIRALEEHGIGRPSTYAAIISTLLSREYVELESRRFRPTDVGRLVNSFVTEHFRDYVDYDFTARLEDDLDAISRGERGWKPLMADFWKTFAAKVHDTQTGVTRREAAQARDLGIDPSSGRPVTVRMGRFGAYVQIGGPEGEDKPRFAGLRRDQRMNTITLEEALALFQLPRELGQTREGEPVSVSIGRFGPYVRYGSKYASLPKEDDPYTVELPRALEVIEAKRQADAARHIKSFDEDGIRVLNGRFGPYITDGKRNARVPKDRDAQSISLVECKELLEKAPPPRGRRAGGGRRRGST